MHSLSFNPFRYEEEEIIFEKEEEQEDILSGRGGDAAADEGGKVREHDQSLEVDAVAEVFGEENRESSQEEIQEEDGGIRRMCVVYEARN